MSDDEYKEEHFIQEVEMVRIEIEMEQDSIELIEKIAELTGLPTDKIIENAIMNSIISDALAESRRLEVKDERTKNGE